jgi:hypothetical protein
VLEAGLTRLEAEASAKASPRGMMRMWSCSLLIRHFEGQKNNNKHFIIIILPNFSKAMKDSTEEKE